MKILFVYSSPINYLKGGIQRATHNLAEEFRFRGHDVLYVSFFRGETPSTAVPQFYLPDVNHAVCEVNARFLKHLISEQCIDVVVNQSGMSPTVCQLLAIVKKSVPFTMVSCIHNSIFGGIENYNNTHYLKLKKAHLSFFLPLSRKRWMKLLMRQLYIVKNRKHYRCLCNESHAVVVLSNVMRKELMSMTGLNDSSNVVVIPNSITIPDVLSPIQERQKVFLYVGKLVLGYKRVDFLLPIWKIFSSMHPDFQLQIIGDGYMRSVLEQEIVKEGIPNISFEGQQPPEQYYQKAFGLILTSCSESFGMVLVEAMSYGVIPFAYDAYAQIHEIVDDEVNGMLAPDNSPRQMALMMHAVVENRVRSQRLSESAIDSSHKYSSEIIAAKWLELFHP